jgi:hypothetical protein
MSDKDPIRFGLEHSYLMPPPISVLLLPWKLTFIIGWVLKRHLPRPSTRGVQRSDFRGNRYAKVKGPENPAEKVQGMARDL